VIDLAERLFKCRCVPHDAAAHGPVAGCPPLGPRSRGGERPSRRPIRVPRRRSHA